MGGKRATYRVDRERGEKEVESERERGGEMRSKVRGREMGRGEQ